MPLSLTTMAVTLAEANAYATARAKTVWTGASTGKDEALRRGQDYIAGRYNAKWATTFDDTTAPDGVKFAIVEAAIRELASPGSMTPDVTLGTAKVLTGVDSLKWTPVKTDVTADDLRPTLTAIEGLLSGYIILYRGPMVA